MQDQKLIQAAQKSENPAIVDLLAKLQAVKQRNRELREEFSRLLNQVGEPNQVTDLATKTA